MTPKFVLAAVAMLACGGASALSQQTTAGSRAAEAPSDAPVIVQPGAPGQPSRALTAVTAQAAPRPPSEADIRFMQDMIMHHGQAVEMTELAKTRAKDPEVQEMARKIDVSQGDEIRWMKQWLTDRGIPIETMGAMEMGGMGGGQTVAEPPPPGTHLGHENSSHTAHTNGNMAGMAGMDHDMAGMDHGSTDHGDMAGMDSKSAGGGSGKVAPQKVDPQDVAPMVGMLTPRQMTKLRGSNGAQFDKLFLTGMMQHHGGALVMVKQLLDTQGSAQDPQLYDFANDVDNTQLAEIDIMQGILRKVNP